MRRVGLTLERQGHIHIEIVHLLVKRRGVRKWYIQTEQKRPDGFTSYSFTLGDRKRLRRDDHDLYLTAREYDPSKTLYWRDGEDGSESTVLGIRLPRVWRRGHDWSTHVEVDKWGVFLVATLDPRVGHWPSRRSRAWAA